MRVTTRMSVGGMVENLGSSYSRISHYQQQLSSGTRLNTPSDDPAALERTLGLKGQLRRIEQFERNIDDGLGWMQLSETVLSDVEGLLVEARGLAIQGASDTYTAAERQVMADQVNELIEHTHTLSQARFRGRYIFGGTQTGESPYQLERDDQGRIDGVTPQGDASGAVVRQVSEDTQMQVNVPGDAVFAGEEGAFARLIELRDALRSDDSEAVRQTLDNLETARQSVSQWRGEIGARANRVGNLRQLHERASIEFSAVLSQSQDVDLAATILNLRQEQDVFQAALASGNTVIPQSLMDFIG